MKITSLSENAKICFAKALVQNELGGQLSLVYKFSFAGGKSGLSFGISQLDAANSANALLCLKDCEFTTDEVAEIRAAKGNGERDTMNAKYAARLLAHKNVVDRWDRLQIDECLTWPLGLCLGVDFKDEEAFVHVADYHNQFGMSRGGKMHNWIRSTGQLVTAEAVRDFKYTTKYGQEQRAKDRSHDDVWRRYWNIVKIMREGA